jgi:hypothetical protein
MSGPVYAAGKCQDVRLPATRHPVLVAAAGSQQTAATKSWSS